jgi:hypothetical protein
VRRPARRPRSAFSATTTVSSSAFARRIATVGLLRATQLRRDADLGSDDNITLLIDSFHDRRSGFLFRTNPNGAMWDAQLVGTEDTDDNWNGIWTVATSRDEGGWTAEFRIPFRTLRFEKGAARRSASMCDASSVARTKKCSGNRGGVRRV